jgi:NAD-dependent dihydropyrimidine dehydrogenase PreA subunit
MPFLISGPCADITDMSCVEECPVDCIYQGDRKLYINPKERISCGACEPVCPVEAIFDGDTEVAEALPHKQDNADFFYQPLPGRDAPLGNPGGARKTGPIGVDTPLVAAQPHQTRRNDG